MVSNPKGWTVEQRTFKKYDKEAVFGRKIEEIN